MRNAALGLFAAVLLPLQSVSAQQVAVSGTIRTNNQPLAGAVVEARVGEHSQAQTVSDASGRYRLRLAPGRYTFAFRLIGYAERRVPEVAVSEGNAAISVDAELTPVAVQLEHTVVTANRHADKALDAPVAIDVVDEQAVKERSAVTALDYVVNVPGVDVAQQGIQGRQVVARGFNQTFGTSLLMLSDYRTASIPSLRGNLSHFITATGDDIDRVEVLRGPASALYGPNAADGVVHFITKSPFESPGTSVSLTGGERSLGQAAVRYAAVPSDRFAFKVSGKFLRAHEWDAPPEPAEITPRDPLVERVGGEARADVKVTSTGTAVVDVGSTLAKRHVEYTSIGASQIKDWRYDFAQLRYSDGRFFAQTFVNINNAGKTFNLRTDAPVYDRSNLIVGQVQHGFDVAQGSTITYGLDVQRTDPRTNATIDGRNENNDVIVETGAYAQAETKLSQTVQLLTAARVDKNDRMNGAVFSPRVSVSYVPRSGQRWWLSYNRAFATPTPTDMFVDIVAARLNPLPYAIRAVGVPQSGFHFARDCAGGLCMMSPFAAGQLPLDATLLWPAVVQIMKANGVDISALPAPTSKDVKTVLRMLDPSAGVFRASAAPTDDIGALKPTITNSVETGYKGLIAGRLLFEANVYATRRENFRGPLAVETPNAFLSTADLAAYFGKFMPAAQAGQLAAGIGGINANAQAPGIPLGTIAPAGPLGGSDIVLTYRNFGRVELWGTDLALQWAASNHVSLASSYSFTSDNFFPGKNPGEPDLSMNAPRHKALFSARWREASHDASAELRTRFVGSFQMIDGVWNGNVPGFAVADAEVGAAIPGYRGARVTLSVENLTDDRHAEFVGAPVIGRLLMTRLEYRF